MAGTKEIRTKIKSVQNTRKVTRALEMVSASKIRRAQDKMRASRPYARLMRQVIGHIAKANGDYKHAFMMERKDVKRVGYVVISTDRGLCGVEIGEPQILGQMKDAVRQAEEAGTLGATMHKLFQRTFSVAKEVRSTTAIGANIVSMAAAAVHLSERIFERVSDQRVLFVGAGEMIELCAAHFGGEKPRRLTIANRTVPRAEAVAKRFGADVLRLDQVGDALPGYDIVVSCTGSPLPVIGLGVVERALKARRRRPIVMVDLAVPRDIEPEVADLNDVFLYTVDDLAQVVDSGLESRQAAVVEAEGID